MTIYRLRTPSNVKTPRVLVQSTGSGNFRGTTATEGTELGQRCSPKEGGVRISTSETYSAEIRSNGDHNRMKCFIENTSGNDK